MTKTMMFSNLEKRSHSLEKYYVVMLTAPVSVFSERSQKKIHFKEATSSKNLYEACITKLVLYLYSASHAKNNQAFHGLNYLCKSTNVVYVLPKC